MSTIQYRLKSAKLRKVKSGDTLDVAFDEITTTDGGEVIVVPVTREGVKLVHQDLLNALVMLVPHLLIISETVTAKSFKKADLESDDLPADGNHVVYGVHIKEKGEQRQVVLLGRKTVSSGRGYNIPLWPVALEDDGDNAYIYDEILTKRVNHYLSEVEAYLGGKFKPNAQTEIPYDNVVQHPGTTASEKTPLQEAVDGAADRVASENTPAEKPAEEKAKRRAS